MAKKVVIKIKEILYTQHISLRELSRLTDIRHAALSGLANQKRQNINLGHVERIADALQLTDIREILDILDIREEQEITDNEAFWNT